MVVSICKHQCLELDASCNREPVQGDKERCDMGSFGYKIVVRFFINLRSLRGTNQILTHSKMYI